MNNSSKRPRRALFAVAAVIIFFLCLEILSFTISKYSFPLARLTENDPKRGYRLKPDKKVELGAGKSLRNYWRYWKDTGYSVEINIDGQGFRGKENRALMDVDLKFICFGDSITFGLDVGDEETYTSYLEMLLAAEFPGRKVRVLNAGVFGYTSRQGLVYAEELIKRERPFAAVFAFGINDIQEMIRRSWCAVPGASDHEIMRGDVKSGFEKIELKPLQSIQEALLGSYSFQIALQAVNALLDPIRIAPFFDLTEQLEKHETKQAAGKSGFYERVRVPPRHHQNNLLEFIKLAQAYGTYPVLVKQKVVPAEYKDGFYQVVQWERDVGVVDLDLLFGRITIEDIRAKVEYNQRLEFYEGLLGKDVIAENPDLWFTTDGMHPNSLGNYLIAQKLLEIIRAQIKR